MVIILLDDSIIFFSSNYDDYWSIICWEEIWLVLFWNIFLPRKSTLKSQYLSTLKILIVSKIKFILYRIHFFSWLFSFLLITFCGKFNLFPVFSIIRNQRFKREDEVFLIQTSKSELKKKSPFNLGTAKWQQSSFKTNYLY